MDGGRTAAAGKDGHGRPCRAVIAAQMGQVRAATFGRLYFVCSLGRGNLTFVCETDHCCT